LYLIDHQNYFYADGTMIQMGSRGLATQDHILGLDTLQGKLKDQKKRSDGECGKIL